MVVGDFLLDTYTIGKVRRISPEAPVSVLNVIKEEHRPGGAGNAILNLISLGAEVVAMGRVGSDSSGKKLLAALAEEKVDVRGIFLQEEFRTPVKNRIIAENQQIIRVDFENNETIPELLEQQVIESLEDLMDGVEVIAISDYAKGFLSLTLLQEIISLGRKKKIPIIVDPKGADFKKYAGATIIKPNLGEAIAASRLVSGSDLDKVALKLFETCPVDGYFITRSEEGITFFTNKGKRFDFPVRVREVKDVTGAGDTVLAMLAFAVANQLSLSESAQLANIAAGIAIERFGCARVSISDLARRLLEEDADNKLFDEDHLMALQAALKGKTFVLLSVDAKEGFSSLTFELIRSLAKDDRELVVYIRNPQYSESFVSLLAALRDVNFIILKNYSLNRLWEKIKPEETYFLEGGKLSFINQESMQEVYTDLV